MVQDLVCYRNSSSTEPACHFKFQDRQTALKTGGGLTALLGIFMTSVLPVMCVLSNTKVYESSNQCVLCTSECLSLFLIESQSLFSSKLTQGEKKVCVWDFARFWH